MADVAKISQTQRKKIDRLLKGRAVLWDQSISCLADFVSMISATLRSDVPYWYRGQEDIKWPLIPSALRDRDPQILAKSVRLFRDFQRIAEAKLDRPPAIADHLKWLQLAQHYRIPSSLLDWSESPLSALYFACKKTEDAIGAVYLLRPVELANLSLEEVNDYIQEELSSSETSKRRRGRKSSNNKRNRKSRIIAIRPVWNSERLVAQRGMFTLHGVHSAELKNNKIVQLQVIPILPENKATILKELHAVGVDEFSLFPEIDKMTEYLKRINELS